ncbi:MAG: tyrosine-type recombinase/integrase [Thermoleophilia bacterium]
MPLQVKAPALLPGTHRTVTVHGTVAQARAERNRLRVAGRPAPEPEAPPGAVPLTEFAGDFLRSRQHILTDATIYCYSEAYRLRIAPVLGHLPLNELSREVLERWWTGVLSEATSHTVAKHALEAIRAILRMAVEWDRIPINHAAGLRLPPPSTHEQSSVERVLSAPQLAQLFATAATRRHETILRAAGEGGLRRGEIIGLRWSDVDLSARRLTVRRSVWHPRTAGGQPIEKSTKGRRARTIPVTHTMAARLTEWQERSLADGHGDPNGFVWPGANGGPMSADSPTQLVERTMRRAGLVDVNGRPLCTLHGLRHTMVSLALLAGVPLLVVSRMAGHADPTVTAKVYAHLNDPSALDAVTQALEGMLAG